MINFKPFTLEEAPNEDNIVEWAEKRLRAIEDRYTGEVYDDRIIHIVKAEIEQVAMVVQQVTGEKPTWSVDIRPHTSYLFHTSPRMDWPRPPKSHHTDKDSLRRQALAKLTPEEIDALGIE